MEKRDYKENNEVLSKVLRAGKRTYFFDLKQTKNQDHYLTITESKRRFDEAKGTFYYEKHKIFLHVQDILNFGKELDEVISFVQSGNINLQPNDDSSKNDSINFEDL
ncbi:MAG: DUF3276 family protein [Bacteroidales bacterium]|jgi:hypothetical protein|nr:DUF3276 family protein [Bacteroidales bacterium]MDD2687238.1 DUF3276 family protein [Bacteroidales bacterium]MDD3331281.1 DUF3276 family protein [Bacteroidales bacterium]MDD3690901.1 DUF3276 family protein [Bacteroidales bacterium]MDD4044386.1 DUF3276 family protein [Bacteroidales bacterium]